MGMVAPISASFPVESENGNISVGRKWEKGE